MTFKIDLGFFYDYSIFFIILLSLLAMAYYYKIYKKSLIQGKNKCPSGFFNKLGMIGTMSGFIFVFLQFDDGNILGTLNGAGFAVVSTLMGLSFDLLYSKEILKYKVEDKNVINYLQELVQNNSSLLSEIKESRIENKESLQKMNNSFNDFAQEMTKNNTESLIKAVQEVMNNFNDKINDNLGETFKRLNSSVENLVLWQDEYKNHLEILTNQISKAINGIKDTDIALSNIANSMETLPRSVTELKELTNHIGIITKEHEKHLDDLEIRLSAFAEMKDKAVTAMPYIEENLKDLTLGLKSNVTSVIENINKSSDMLSKTVEDQGKALNTIVVTVDENITKATSKIEDSIIKILSNIETTIGSQQKSLESTVLNITEGLDESVNTTLNSIKTGFKEQQEYLSSLTKVISSQIEETTNGMDTIIKDTLKIMQTNLSKQQGHITMMVGNLEDKINKSTDGINQVVKDQLSIIRKSSQDLIDEANSSIVSILDKVDENIEKLDAQMQHELTKSVQTLTNNVTGFQKEFIKVHGSMIDTIKNTTNQTINNVRDLR
tara:strand:+ start:3343 stop:4992 length:1650 start_codon:yes stop_codon:yes gene_type:complete